MFSITKEKTLCEFMTFLLRFGHSAKPALSTEIVTGKFEIGEEVKKMECLSDTRCTRCCARTVRKL